ncbi:MAG: DUF502 domain-containing protein [Rhodocyclaceae bacterium]|nr:DUF502 domain-containing protein [Rhodocyclaceae bacterium]
MKVIGKIFATGLLAVVPIGATLYLLVWMFTTAESLFGALLVELVPTGMRFPGIGVLLGLFSIFCVGLMMRAWLFRKLFHRIEDAVMSIPLVKSVYSALRDFFGLITQDGQQDLLRVVAVTLPGSDMRLIGFVTRTDFSMLPAGIAREGDVMVYCPMSYQIGGYTLLVPETQLEPLDMPREAAMRFALTAGVNAGPPRRQG